MSRTAEGKGLSSTKQVTHRDVFTIIRRGMEVINLFSSLPHALYTMRFAEQGRLSEPTP